MVAIIHEKLVAKSIQFLDTHGFPTQGYIHCEEYKLYFRFRNSQFKIEMQNSDSPFPQDRVLYMNYFFDKDNVDKKFIIENTRSIISYRDMIIRDYNSTKSSVNTINNTTTNNDTIYCKHCNDKIEMGGLGDLFRKYCSRCEPIVKAYNNL